jgi:hypothetical protein
LQQRPVPAAKRLRIDGKAGPALVRQQAAGRSEQGPVDARVLRTLAAAPEDRQLVAQHDDLKLPLTATAGKHAKETAQEPVEQRHQHEAQSEPARPRSPVHPSPAESTFFTPHRPVGIDAEDLVADRVGHQPAARSARSVASRWSVVAADCVELGALTTTIPPFRRLMLSQS